MSQYTCHCCQQVFDKATDPCFIVRLTAFLEIEPQLDEYDREDTDHDHLATISDALEKVQSLDDPTLHEDQLERNFQLCRDCYQRFMADPITRDPASSITFSAN
ncbi:hypothetical protein [Blastopirellula retiformator]|uniref:Uncharacterized protein n=1 Tax=Blastopirellula retiformator TaxID=2527970 RepID=A0A5C5VN05_9BACT|nr:hypothetical protein [Blastopirellula retiformator]TWT39437.1 hypothetical protein Enr8_11360 [Blastopirellula retiformator]